MPKTIKYNQLKHPLSLPRIQTYRTFFCNHSEEEVYGVYLWNKILCGAVYPLLQACEIALRNAINTPAVNRFGDYWYEAINHHQFNPTSNYDDRNYTKLVQNFEKARKSVVFKLNKQRQSNGQPRLPQNHKPDFNLVVASTDFSTWEYALHHCHYKVGSTDFIWPKQTKKSFKNWPNQSSYVTQTTVYDIVSELRPFRNRLSHHEPLWKGVNVANEVQALAFVNQKIDKIETLLSIISDEKARYLDVQKLLVHARYTASKEMLDRCRYRAKSKTLSLKRKNKMRKFLNELSLDGTPKLIKVAGHRFLIEAV